MRTNFSSFDHSGHNALALLDIIPEVVEILAKADFRSLLAACAYAR